MASFGKKSLEKDGDLTHLKIEVVDEDGNVVTKATNIISLDIEGAGELLGVESGELDGLVDLKSHSRKAFEGKLLAFLRPLQKKGIVTVQITSPGLEPKTLEIPVK